MSLRTIGYIDGKPIRIDEGPGGTPSTRIGGSMVVGAPGPVEQQRLAAKAHVRRMREADGRCGAWMPKAQATCIRTAGHRSDHRATRDRIAPGHAA